ncbi:MAG: DUF6600 domain-containing protein [Methyloceanibacter sp.]
MNLVEFCRHVVVAAAVIAVAVLGVSFKSAHAQEPNAYPVTDVNLRAGPGTEYPIILTVSYQEPITIVGCLADHTWCDTVYQDQRGWMSAVYLAGLYEGEYYPLRDYAPSMGFEVVTFDVDAYWGEYYSDRPFYQERSRWAGGGYGGEGYVDDQAVFYDRLAPHGEWAWMQGRYVWVPSRVNRDWRPYTDGRWAYTDRGWTWVSNEPHGWATYHYGRWGYSNRVGWFWVPGKRWAPAWVSWRQSDDYLAWAPLPPSYDDGGDVNININVGDVPDYYWQAVPNRSFLDDDLPRRIVRDRTRIVEVVRRTRPIGYTTVERNVVVNRALTPKFVEEKTRKKVVARKIALAQDADRPGKVTDDAVEVFRPKAGQKARTAAPPKPRKVEEVAAESPTKGQIAKGEATTEEMMLPPEVKAAKAIEAEGKPLPRPGAPRKGKPAGQKAGPATAKPGMLEPKEPGKPKPGKPVAGEEKPMAPADKEALPPPAPKAAEEPEKPAPMPSEAGEEKPAPKKKLKPDEEELEAAPKTPDPKGAMPSEPAPGAEPEAKPKPEPMPRKLPKAKPEPMPKKLPKPEPESMPKTLPKAEPKPLPKAMPDAAPEPKVRRAPKAQPEPGDALPPPSAGGAAPGAGMGPAPKPSQGAGAPGQAKKGRKTRPGEDDGPGAAPPGGAAPPSLPY